jgi:hypothetical protein
VVLQPLIEPRMAMLNTKTNVNRCLRFFFIAVSNK